MNTRKLNYSEVRAKSVKKTTAPSRDMYLTQVMGEKGDRSKFRTKYLYLIAAEEKYHRVNLFTRYINLI